MKGSLKGTLDGPRKGKAEPSGVHILVLKGFRLEGLGLWVPGEDHDPGFLIQEKFSL